MRHFYILENAGAALVRTEAIEPPRFECGLRRRGAGRGIVAAKMMPAIAAGVEVAVHSDFVVSSSITGGLGAWIFERAS